MGLRWVRWKERACSATGSAPSAAVEVKRWSSGRKKQVVLRLLRGESVDALSRELAVPIYRLEEWRDRALAGIDVGLKERESDPVEQQLDDAKPAGVNSYSLPKLYAYAKEWEKPLVKETEDKLGAIRCEASHVIKALRAIRNAAKAASTAGGDE